MCECVAANAKCSGAGDRIWAVTLSLSFHSGFTLSPFHELHNAHCTMHIADCRMNIAHCTMHMWQDMVCNIWLKSFHLHLVGAQTSTWLMPTYTCSRRMAYRCATGYKSLHHQSYICTACTLSNMLSPTHTRQGDMDCYT